MKYLKLFISVFLLVSCASQPPEVAFSTRLYKGNYDDVWLAALKALNDYPLRVSNKDAGRILTETVNGPYNDLLFTSPKPIEQPERFRYTLKLSFARLVSDRTNQRLIRVRVIKELEQFQDFYTGWLAYPSDGVEEKMLLYRVEQILQMEKSLEKRSKSP